MSSTTGSGASTEDLLTGRTHDYMSEHAAADRQNQLRKILLYVAASAPRNIGELSRRITRPEESVEKDLSALMNEGTVHSHKGVLRTAAAPRILADATGTELREVYDRVLAEPTLDPTTSAATLIALAESGCTDEALLDLLIAATGRHPDDAGLERAFRVVSRALGESEESLLLRRASDAAGRCRPDEVLAFTEPIIAAAPPDRHSPAQTEAILLSSMALIQTNRLDRASLLFEQVGEDQLGADAAWAVVAAVGQGDLVAAKRWRKAMPRSGVTNKAAGLADFADGLLTSAEGSGEGALELLASSATTLALLGDEVRLPETPAAVGTMVALGRGDPATAEILLERALRLGLGNDAGRRRHILLLAWEHMVRGHLDTAERKLADLDGPGGLCDRDLLMYWCVRGGLARRRSDLSSMHDSWREIREHSLGMQTSLYDLLPLGEMMVLAARLQESGSVAPLIQSASELLANMHNPAVWATPLHWHGVQAAFQSEDPAALLPHANALMTAGNSSPYAATLAAVGHTWLEVLRGEVDFASVEESARMLSSMGHAWEASTLAGQAALQHPERESALSMMQLAREISKEQGGPRSRPAASQSVLTPREREVAVLVLHGHSYRTIGKRLFISPKTVEHHVARIRGRLGAASRTELLEKLHALLADESRA